MRRPSRIAWVLLLAALAVAPPAGAAERRVLVFQLDGSVPNDPGDGISRLTKVVARAAGLTGADVIEGQASFDDTATLAGCSTPDAPCFAKVAEALKVDYVVMGTIEPSPDGSARASLKLYKDGTVNEHEITLPAGDLEAMVQAMARDVPPLFVGPASRREEDKPPPPPPPEVTDKPEPTPVLPPSDEPKETGFARVGATWWILGATGVLAASASFVAFGMAQKKQDEVDSAPTNTMADFDRLVKLEDEGERLTLIGNGLLIGGAALTAVSAAVILYQGLSGEDEEEASRASLVPVPLRGGLGLSLEVRLP